MGPLKCIGRCLPPFLAAVVWDLLGVTLLFVGIFGDVRAGGRFYGDFLIYTGALVLFTSLAFWFIWYLGNVRVSEEDGDGWRRKRSGTGGGGGGGGGVARLARKLTERLSQKLKAEKSVKSVKDAEPEPEPTHLDGQVVEVVGAQGPREASRVTWGRSTEYHNEGYEESVDSHSVEMDPEEKGQI